jgi:DNA-binding HxlR family transcriptional regulator
MTEMSSDTSTLMGKYTKGDVFAEKCPSRQVLNHVTSRWGVLILTALLEGTHRFSELRRKIGGVSERMLAQTLQSLENDGIVLRTAYPVVPPHVEYSLTLMGEEVAFRMKLLADWVEENIVEILEIQQQKAAEKSSSY